MKTDHIDVIQFGTRQILYRLHCADRKRLRIVVSPDLTVDVFVPENVGNEQAQIAIQKKAPWIARALDKLESYHPLPTPKQYVSGETFMYLGRQYRLKVEEDEKGQGRQERQKGQEIQIGQGRQKGQKRHAKLSGRFLWVCVKDKTHTESIKRTVNDWYRTRAQETFGRYLEKCYAIASRHGVPEPLLTVRTMAKRWGSCSSSGRITLNVNLVQTPVHCIEYVIMHELCHLKHHDHSRKFYSLLTRCQPDWRKRKETLDHIRLS